MLHNRTILTTLLFLAISVGAGATDITGAGSSAAKPIYAKWAEAYSKTSGVKLHYEPIGSSGGIKQIKARAVDFGASDVAMSAAELKKEKLINFPSAISGVVPVINVPGIKSGELMLSGEILADIFAGKITYWNDPAIAAVNRGLTLPKTAIVTVVRQDGSGTTYNFTDYLSKVSTGWKDAFGTNFTIKWHEHAMPAKGNAGVATAVQQTGGAIGYVDYNYVVQEHLNYVLLKNRDGKFVAPSATAFAAALNHSDWLKKAAFEEMLTDKAGASSWPITMGTFVIIPQATQQPESTIAAMKFFCWGFIQGDHLIAGMDFVRLPDAVQARIFKELTKVTDGKGKPLQWSPM